MAIKLTSTNLTKNLVRRTKLVQYLDRAIDAWDETGFAFAYEPKEKDDAFHPSGDCLPGVVDLYDKALDHLDGEDTFGPISTSLRKTFLVGHFWHQFLQFLIVEKLEFADPNHVERMGVRAWGEPEWGHGVTDSLFPGKGTNFQKPRPFHWARGSADIAPCVIPRHGEWVVDFKTMNAMDFNRNYAPAHFVKKWEAQLNIYMDWFDLEKAMIVGVCKDNPHEFKEFEFVRNQPLIDAIYQKWMIVSEYLDAGETPHIFDEPALEFLGPVQV